jgi:hypothetical protein
MNLPATRFPLPPGDLRDARASWDNPIAIAPLPWWR